MAQPWWKPVWSVPAAMRAVRATVVVPSLFAISYKVIGNPQVALFATFGGFATLVIASFNGTRRDKLGAHLGLAVAGSLALIIGTLVSGTTWLAAVVTVPVTFAIFFAGIGGPNAASGSTAAMFAYVLPVASAGDASHDPQPPRGLVAGVRRGHDRGAAAVTAPAGQPAAGRGRRPGRRARGRVRAAAGGEVTKPEAMLAARERLRAAFTAAPYRPTGLATADQALSSLVQLLEWAAAQASDSFDGHIDLTTACPEDRDLLRRAAGLFDDISALLSASPADPDIAGTEAARARSAEQLSELSGRPGEPDARLAAAQAVHAQGISLVAESAVADALIVSHRASQATIEAERRYWYGTAASAPVAASAAVPQWTAASPRVAGLAGAATLVRRHASIRSVWFLNSLRGALALAAAVAVADLSGVQHGFWVVLGTLSVLRTSAAATGATAWRALAGTAVGFAIGAALLVGIGTGQAALWVTLPLAISIAAYAPGTTPFLVGQAAFTVTIVVLFNLLVPAGWRVGLLRVEDVAIGCAVSLAVGVLFWPRGVSSLVGDDLADAFRRRRGVPDAGGRLGAERAAGAARRRGRRRERGHPARRRGARLPHRAGHKKLSKEDLWALVNASMRLRLTAHTLAGLRLATPVPAPPGAGVTGRCRVPAARGLGGVRGRAGLHQRCGRPRPAWPGSTRRSPTRCGHPGRQPRAGARAAAHGPAPCPAAGREGEPPAEAISRRPPVAAPAPAVGAGAPAPPQPERADGERPGAAAGRGPPAPLVAIARYGATGGAGARRTVGP